MALTPFDIENLDRSMQGVGQAFAQNRAQALQAQHYDIENAVRQRMLDAEERRMAAEEGRQNRLAEGTVEATLQSEDGGQMTYRGPQSGYQGMIDAAAAKGVKLTPVPAATKKPLSIKIYRDDGDVELYADTPDQLNSLADKVKQGHQTRDKGQPTYGPVQADKAATDLEDQADKIDAQAQNIPTPSLDRVSASQQSARLRQRAAALRQSMQRPDQSQFQTVTTTGHQDPNNLMSPEVKTTQRVKVGSTPAAPGATGAPAVGTVSKGYRFKGGDPSSPSNWEKVQ